MPTVAALTHIYFQLGYAVDKGKTGDVDEAEDALVDEELMEYINKVDEVDLTLFDDDQWEDMNKLFARYGIPDADRLSVYNNGYLYVMANIVEIIQHDNWHRPGASKNLDVGELEINKDW